MECKYYVQEYAVKRAEKILPVPKNYPLRGDFGHDFNMVFSDLTKILKKIYLDASKNPSAYGCELYPLNKEARNNANTMKTGVDNESNTTLDRIVKCLRILFDCGEIDNHTLKVNAEHFKKQIKKVKNYSAVIEKLTSFGFSYQGNIFDKNTECFYVMYLPKPYIIDALKIYMNCWNEVLNDEYLKSEIKKNGYGYIAGYYDFYLFDYKVTANPKELEPVQLIKDKCYFWNKDKANIFMAFYNYSYKYPDIRFSDGNYYIRKNRIATFRYDDRREFLSLKLKLRNPSNYIHEIEKLPKYLQKCFSDKAKKCERCGCLGNNPDTCSNRILWKFDDIDYIGCSMGSFYFNDIKNEDIPRLFVLLEYEYGIKKQN